MKTNDILNKCTEIPGISMKKGPVSTELCMKQADGDGTMTFFPVFPGISVAYIFVNSPAWAAPDLSGSEAGPLLLNYCVTGRCELFLDNDSFVYVKDGEFSLTERSAQTQYIYPRRIYEGLEFFIDKETVSGQSGFIKEFFELDVSELGKRYCPDGQTYISGCGRETARIFQNIWALFHQDPKYAVRKLKIYTLELFELLLNRRELPQKKTCTFFTSTQVEIAKKTEEIITADLRKHHPVRELSEMFCVSETSIKNYFRGVYGQNISLYQRELRMKTAASLLQDTKLSIALIAEQVGYVNQSKFSSVFKQKFQMTPLEYRRKKALEHK